MALTWDITEEWWDIMLDVNLKGVWLAIKYTVPQMIARNQGGRILITSSVAGLRGEPGMAHYCASKWGVVGLAKTLAQELSTYSITVNTLHPTAVNTDIISGMAKAASMETEDLVDFIYTGHALPVKLIEAADVASAALWLASDEARYVTGHTLKVDAGQDAEMNLEQSLPAGRRGRRPPRALRWSWCIIITTAACTFSTRTN